MFLFLLPTWAMAQERVQRIEDVFTPLPPQSVELTNFLENDITNSIRHWQKEAVPYPKLVEFFRSGHPQFALGEMWGKAVRSGAMFYRYRADEELKQILKATVADLLTTTRANGSISCAPPEMQPESGGGDMWERKYVLLGLSQYYRQVAQDPAVLQAMEREAQSIIDQVGDTPKVDITTLGWSANKIESSSLLEPMMRLYFLTGKAQYLDFASYIVRRGGCSGSDLFQQAYDGVWPRLMGNVYPKAYEMLSVFEGLAEYYRATGDSRWMQCLKNMYEGVRDREITIIGNGGADQPYFPQWAGEAWSDTRFEQTNPKQKRMMETCIGVTWMKFCSQMLRLTGNPETVDYIERYIYNGLLGAMKPSGDGFSYVNLLNGEKVTNQGWGWHFDGRPVTCCNLNGPMGLAYIPFVLAMQAKEGPVVNLYNAAHIRAKTEKGSEVEIEVDTEFPRDRCVEIRLYPKHRETFTLRLRIPGWSQATECSINGKRVKDVKSGTYLTLRRRWKPGDRVKLTFDMRCRLIPAPHGSNRDGDHFQALTYGPIVLARDENIDASYMQPVQIVTDENGEVEIHPTASTLPSTRMEFVVPTTDGPIRMVDYASVDGWTGKHVCTWMPTK
ncbi:MAG: glycoside hydrolase family 127 protein [Bacteroidaceae bacterium]|nr:glycoside hydrolase family 127 protein [Bacteroidaceae bacterium]